MTRSTAPDWTEAEDEWLRECYPLYPNAELAEFKALDGWPRDEAAIARRARTLGLRKDPSRGYVRKVRAPTIWTPEKDEWFRAFVPGHTEAEISAEHERIWGFPLRVGQIANRKVALGVKSGTHGGRFAKGHVTHNKGRTWDEYGTPEGHERSRATTFARGNHPHNEGELLDERRAAHNVWQVKVNCRDAKNPMGYWVSRARFNWERANARPWPEGCRALHLDGDEENDSADNIVPVPDELWPMVCGAVRGQMEWHDRETLEAAMLSARITLRRSELARERRAVEGHPWAQDAKFAGRDSRPRMGENE